MGKEERKEWREGGMTRGREGGNKGGRDEGRGGMWKIRTHVPKQAVGIEMVMKYRTFRDAFSSPSSTIIAA
jgi:hypothetical protein